MNVSTFMGESKGHILAQMEEFFQTHQATLAIVFSSVSQDYKGLSKDLTKRGIRVWGCTTAGEIESGTTAEKSISCMLLDVPQDCFHIISRPISTGNIIETSQEMAEDAQKHFPNPAILVVGSGISTDGEAIVTGTQAVLGKKVRMVWRTSRRRPGDGSHLCTQ